MKKLFAILALSLSTFAAADSVMIFQTNDNYTLLSNVTNTFQINPDLGRAWVNVSIATNEGDSTFYDDTRVKVEGLSMNAEKTAVVYAKDGKVTECATVTKKRGIFGTNLIIRPTGACKLVSKEAKITVDNGFEVYQQAVIQVYLIVE